MKHRSRQDRLISRRRFLKGMGAAAGGLLVAACNPKLPVETPAPTAKATPMELVAPTAKATPTETPVPAAGPGPTTTPHATSVSSDLVKVATARASDYDKALVRQQLRTMLDSLGGLEDVIRSGDRVAIKTNLTGGTRQRLVAGLPATETYVTHPVVVEALAELLIDAGAGGIHIVEAVYDERSFPLWGYEDAAKRLGASLVDLNDPEPHNDFSVDPVGDGWFIYQGFYFHRVLSEVDALVSVSKLKGHASCGVTHTMKNLIGLVPMQHYELSGPGMQGRRSEFHGEGEETRARLPRVIVDLNRAHPVQLGLVDGIKTMEGGEGPWIEGVSCVEPGVLIAGKNAVATDAVATAVIGFDPTAEYPDPPFLHCDNHLRLAHDMGLGTNRLEAIEVFGPPIDEIRRPFKAV